MIAGEVSLSDHVAVMDLLHLERKRQGMEVWALESKSGISASAFFAWRREGRSASLSCMIALAQTLGFELFMRHPSGRVVILESVKGAMAVLNQERRERGLTPADCERMSGVSASTLFALSGGSRDTRVQTMVNIGEALGFALMIRRKN